MTLPAIAKPPAAAAAGIGELSVRAARWWMLLVLLLAAGFRLYGLNNLSPPGLEHDEVANWLIDQSILRGQHAIYFTDAYGHEAGFHYLQTAFVRLLGDHALALRLPAAFAGLLLVSASYALARRLFGRKTALMSAALLAVLFWPVFYSRLGLRAISLPLVSALSAYFWWKGWPTVNSDDREGTEADGRRDWFLALSGFLAGAAIHTYMAARVVPIFYALFTVYLAVLHWRQFRQRKRGLVLFWLLFLVTAAPLFGYLQTNPGSEFRITEIDAPLRALASGDLNPVLENSVRIIGLFGFAGDPLWRQNVANLPVFDPVVAALFYLSVLLSMLRFLDSRYAFLLLWLLSSTTPSLVTIDAPSTIRIVNILPVLTLFPVLVMHNLWRLSTVINKLSTKTARMGLQLGLLLLFLYYIGLTSWATFWEWPENEEVQFVWQAALTDVATYLDESTDAGAVAIAGWTSDTMDPPTMLLTLRRDDLALSFFDPSSSLLIPANSPGEAVRIARPAILQMDPLLEGKLEAWGAQKTEADKYVLYTLAAAPEIEPQHGSAITFDGEIQFTGYDLLRSQPSAVEMITYWRVVGPVTGPRRLFLHVLDQQDELINEAYAFDRADARWQSHWQVGDIILQHHLLTIDQEVPDHVQLRLGLFDPNSCPPEPCRNLLSASGDGFVTMPLGK